MHIIPSMSSLVKGRTRRAEIRRHHQVGPDKYWIINYPASQWIHFACCLFLFLSGEAANHVQVHVQILVNQALQTEPDLKLDCFLTKQTVSELSASITS